MKSNESRQFTQNRRKCTRLGAGAAAALALSTLVRAQNAVGGKTPTGAGRGDPLVLLGTKGGPRAATPTTWTAPRRPSKDGVQRFLLVG
jgi:hypothetical protein